MIKLNYILSVATGVLNMHASFNSILLIIYIMFAVNSYTRPQMDFFKKAY